MARIGVLTGGGDCAGLDAIIRAVVRRSRLTHGDDVIGFRHGWKGVLEDNTFDLTIDRTAGILTRGGTSLGTSRVDPLAGGPEALDAINDTIERNNIDALIVIGGDGTLRGSRELMREGVPMVAVPKTIDNDVDGTDLSVGFSTAVQVATDAIDRLQTTAESHRRVMVVEVMGRDAGWIAACAGLAGGADVILVPERPFDIDLVCERLLSRNRRGRNYSIVVVAEGARPAEELSMPTDGPVLAERTRVVESGIAITLQHELEERTGFETRATILGHILRGGTPVASDRILATRFGIAASDAVKAGQFGTMTSLDGKHVVQVGLEDALRFRKPLDPEIFDAASVFFG